MHSCPLCASLGRGRMGAPGHQPLYRSRKGAKRMKTLSRDALSLWGAAILLAGCGGSQVTGLSPSQQFVNSATSPLSGGAFSASYSGQYSVHDCGFGCNRWEFRGSGPAKFLGHSRERMRWFFILDARRRANGATLTSYHSKTDGIKVTINLTNQCASNSYVVTGGTGRFAHATGSGTISTTCNVSEMTYSDSWTGTLYY